MPAGFPLPVSSWAEDFCSFFSNGSSCASTPTKTSSPSETKGNPSSYWTSLPTIATVSLSAGTPIGATLAFGPPISDSSAISATVEESSSATAVQSDSSPSQASEIAQSATSPSFLQNKEAVGCTFAALALLILLALAGTHLLRKRRRRQRRWEKGLSNPDLSKKMRLSGTTMADSLQDVYASQGKEYDMLDE